MARMTSEPARRVRGPVHDLVPGLPARLHLLGAGGAGLSGAARLLLARGHRPSGHDRAESRFVAALRAAGVDVDVGPSSAARLPDDVAAVVRSAAVAADDPLVVEAQRRGLPVHKYGRVLGALCPPGLTLGVAGTHGKTTTAWMLHHALCGVAEVAGRTAPAPGALVGGVHRRLKTNAVPPEPGGWFAVEACEYDRTFLQLAPQGALVTNVEADHLDYYGSLAAVEEAFARFAGRVPSGGLVVLGADVPACVEAAASARVWRLGRELKVQLLGEERGHFLFRLRGPGWATPTIALAVPGAFNVGNAALACALAIGLVAETWRLEIADAAAAVARAVSRFPGAERRFESWGAAGGVEVVHDYAHHPTEVRAVLETARRVFPGQPLHVLFQPHQHSRTARFLAEFVEALRGADRVVVADVYGARAQIDDVSAGAPELARRLQRAHVEAAAPGDAPRAVRELAAGLFGEGVALVLGAGDIDGIRDDLIGELALRRAAPRGSVL